MSDYITWTGGESPVPPLTHVLVKFRDSDFDIDEPFYSQTLDWQHEGDGAEGAEADIIAYRLADVQPVFQTWTGGANPAGESLVEYILRDSPDMVNYTNANNLDWAHEADDPDYDIILYRIIE